MKAKIGDMELEGTAQELAQFFNQNKPEGVKRKYTKRKYTKRKKSRGTQAYKRWTKKEDNYIRKMYNGDNDSLRKVAILLNRGFGSVYSRVYTLGLK